MTHTYNFLVLCLLGQLCFSLRRADFQNDVSNKGDLLKALNKLDNYDIKFFQLTNQFWNTFVGIDQEQAMLNQFNTVMREVLTSLNQKCGAAEPLISSLFKEFKNEQMNYISKASYQHIAHFLIAFYKDNYNILDVPGFQKSKDDLIGSSKTVNLYFFDYQWDVEFPLTSPDFFLGFETLCSHFGFSDALRKDKFFFNHFSKNSLRMDGAQLGRALRFFESIYYKLIDLVNVEERNKELAETPIATP